MTAFAGQRAGGAAGPFDHAGVEFGVPSRVFHQVVTPHEPFLAQRTGEPLLPGVGAVVASQLVRSGKALVAVLPVARERPLTCIIKYKKIRKNLNRKFSNSSSTSVIVSLYN